MTTLMKLARVLMVLVTVAGLAGCGGGGGDDAQDIADLTGDWDMIDMSGMSYIALHLLQDGAGLSGTADILGSTMPVTGSVSGNIAVVTLSSGGLTTSCTGILSDGMDRIDGTYTASDGRSGTFVAVFRKAGGPDDLNGTWRLNNVTSGSGMGIELTQTGNSVGGLSPGDAARTYSGTLVAGTVTLTESYSGTPVRLLTGTMLPGNNIAVGSFEDLASHEAGTWVLTRLYE